MTNTVYLTRKGIKDLKKSIAKLEQRKHHLQRDLRELDKTTRHDDRLILNEKLAELDTYNAEIREKTMLLANAKPVPKQRNSLQVAIGSVVELIDRQGKRLRYTLVDSPEADPTLGKISIKSPLGSHLVGKQIRDIVEWTVGQRRNTMTLVGIS